MNVLRRLYRYLRAYKTWASIAFGSMIVFALTQTVLAALVQPLFDEVLSPPAIGGRASRAPAAGVSPDARPPSRENYVERLLDEQLPAIGRAKDRFDAWWDADPSQKGRRVLTLILLVFVVRALTSF